MILPWKRKEVYMGFDMQQMGRVLNVLSAAHIRYYEQTANHGVLRNRSVSAGNTNYSLMYYVYVHRDDYDQACYLIHQAR